MSTPEKDTGSALRGTWVVNTRGPKQAGQLDDMLEARGAHPVSYPCIDIVPPLDPAPLDDALRRLAAGDVEWLVLTSANAVEAVEGRLEELGIPATALSGTSAAAVGPGTGAVLKDRLGVEADLVPQEYVAEALAEQLLARQARRVLVPQAERARETLGHILSANGVEVEAVTAYRTVLGSGGDDVPGLLRDGRVDAVVFASPSAVKNMAVRFERENGDWTDLRKVCVACIGPVTSAAAEQQGLKVQVQPREHTIPGLVDGLEGYYREGTRSGGQVP